MENAIFWDVALVRIDILEECIASIIRDDGSNAFLQNVGSYKSHMVSHPRRLLVTTVKPSNLTNYGMLVMKK
jgi:hypothetical protein